MHCILVRLGKNRGANPCHANKAKEQNKNSSYGVGASRYACSLCPEGKASIGAACKRVTKSELKIIYARYSCGNKYTSEYVFNGGGTSARILSCAGIVDSIPEPNARTRLSTTTGGKLWWSRRHHLSSSRTSAPGSIRRPPRWRASVLV